MNQVTLKVISYTENSSDIQFIRNQVYHLEQGIELYRVFDEYDKTLEHILAYLEQQAVGTARIRYLNRETASIERLAVLSTARRRGIGRKILEKALEFAAQNSVQDIVINAQYYIKGLYQEPSFEQEGEKFIVAGNPHALIKMRKRLEQLR
jgi:predicted GNAT family N-acyltransferase